MANLSYIQVAITSADMAIAATICTALQIKTVSYYNKQTKTYTISSMNKTICTLAYPKIRSNLWKTKPFETVPDLSSS